VSRDARRSRLHDPDAIALARALDDAADDSDQHQHRATPDSDAFALLSIRPSLGRAIASYPEDLRVVVIGTGGLSHQLDGERAGFINPAFDRMCLQKIVDAPDELASYATLDLIREAGLKAQS